MDKKIICFGEVLWDILPTGKVAGGAPMNVAIRLQSLGISSAVISTIGDDELGEALRSLIKERGVDSALIKVNKQLPTGQVWVQFDDQGNAIYDIVYPSAWDKIEYSGAFKHAVNTADALVFGSLACRDEVSRDALLQLLEVAHYKVFDVNLRTPHYTISLVEELMKKSDFIKLNEEELLWIAQSLESGSAVIEENIVFISEKTQTDTICITSGKDGAVLYTNEQFYYHSGYSVTVEDTIGAGDSFLAALLYGMFNHQPFDEVLSFACATGALVASRKGANPIITVNEINQLVKAM